MTYQSFVQTHKIYLAILVIVGGTLLLGTFIVNQRLEAQRSLAARQAMEQQTILFSIAETTANNGADASTDLIVRDCAVTQRVRFDELLGSLDSGLSIPELQELDQLFALCASFHAERKAAMVARLVREIEVYESYVAQVGALTGRDESNRYNVSLWKKLAEEEQKQSLHFQGRVTAQKEIIDTLIAGHAATSEQMLAILAGVRETQEALLSANVQAAAIREELRSL